MNIHIKGMKKLKETYGCCMNKHVTYFSMSAMRVS